MKNVAEKPLSDLRDDLRECNHCTGDVDKSAHDQSAYDLAKNWEPDDRELVPDGGQIDAEFYCDICESDFDSLDELADHEHEDEDDGGNRYRDIRFTSRDNDGLRADGGRDRVVDYVEEDGGATGYVVAIERLDPGETPELAKAGYTTPTTLYTVMTGGEVHADYNRHRLVREKLPGRNDWLHEEFARLKSEVWPDE